MKGYSSILVYVGLDLVGDALMKLPFVRALRATYPDARITWLAGKGKTAFAGPLAPLVVGQIDEVIESAGIGTHWHEVLRRPLPGRRFDLLIDTQRRVLTTLILRRIACGTFVSGAANFALSDLKPRGRSMSASPPAPAEGTNVGPWIDTWPSRSVRRMSAACRSSSWVRTKPIGAPIWAPPFRARCSRCRMPGTAPPTRAPF
jgi:hypothetical protein